MWSSAISCVLRVLADGAPLCRSLAIDGALNGEQRIETLHGLKRNQINRVAALAATLAARSALDIGQFEELAPCMSKAASFEEPFMTLLQDVGSVLLDGMASLFLRVIPRCTKKRCSPATETTKPISARARRSSSSEMSLRASQSPRMSVARS